MIKGKTLEVLLQSTKKFLRKVFYAPPMTKDAEHKYANSQFNATWLGGLLALLTLLLSFLVQHSTLVPHSRDWVYDALLVYAPGVFPMFLASNLLGYDEKQPSLVVFKNTQIKLAATIHSILLAEVVLLHATSLLPAMALMGLTQTLGVKTRLAEHELKAKQKTGN